MHCSTINSMNLNLVFEDLEIIKIIKQFIDIVDSLKDKLIKIYVINILFNFLIINNHFLIRYSRFNKSVIGRCEYFMDAIINYKSSNLKLIDNFEKHINKLLLLKFT